MFDMLLKLKGLEDNFMLFYEYMSLIRKNALKSHWLNFICEFCGKELGSRYAKEIYVSLIDTEKLICKKCENLSYDNWYELKTTDKFFLSNNCILLNNKIDFKLPEYFLEKNKLDELLKINEKFCDVDGKFEMIYSNLDEVNGIKIKNGVMCMLNIRDWLPYELDELSCNFVNVNMTSELFGTVGCAKLNIDGGVSFNCLNINMGDTPMTPIQNIRDIQSNGGYMVCPPVKNESIGVKIEQ